jgi:hypothetical protein
MVFWDMTPCSLVGELRRQGKIWELTRLHGALTEYAVKWNSLLFGLLVQCAFLRNVAHFALNTVQNKAVFCVKLS